LQLNFAKSVVLPLWPKAVSQHFTKSAFKAILFKYAFTYLAVMVGIDAVSPRAAVLVPYKQAVSRSRNFGYGLVAYLRLRDLQVFTKLSHTGQFYEPDDAILKSEDCALKQLFAGPVGSIQSGALRNFKMLGFKVQAQRLQTVAQVTEARVVFHTSKSFLSNSIVLQESLGSDECILHSARDIAKYHGHP
jgi:hypothetical protein